MEPLHPLHPGLGLKAIPRHLLVQFLRQAEQEQRLVAEISRLLAQPFRLQQLLHDICRGVRQVLGYMAVSIMLVDEAGTTLTIEGYDGVEPNYVQQLNRTLAVRLDHPTLGQGPSATAFRTGQPQAVGNVYTDPRFQPWVALRPGFAAMIALPLTFRGTGIGVLNCYTHRPHQFEPREVALLEAVASLVAAAVGIASLLDCQERQLQQLEEQRQLLLHSQTIHRRLTAIVLEGKSRTHILHTLSELVGNPALALDANGRLLEATPAGTGGLEELQAALARELERLGPRPPAPVRLEVTPPATAVSIAAGERVLGYLAVQEAQRPLSPLDQVALEQAATVLALVFLREEALWETTQRLRRDLLVELLRQDLEAEEEVREWARRLGYQVDGPCQVVVLQVEGPSAREAEHRRRVLWLLDWAGAGRHPDRYLYAEMSGRYVALWPLGDRDAWALASSFCQRYRKLYPNHAVAVGIGRPASGLRELRRSYEEALDAIRLLRRFGQRSGVLDFGELGIHATVLRAAHPAELRALAARRVDPILAYDQRWGTDLYRTLTTYLENQARVKETARALYLHPNTVTYRLNKIQEITNLNLRDLTHLLELQLAVLVHRLLGQPPPAQEAEGGRP